MKHPWTDAGRTPRALAEAHAMFEDLELLGTTPAEEVEAAAEGLVRDIAARHLGKRADPRLLG